MRTLLHIAHNLLAHPLLVLCPPLGRWLHEISAPEEPAVSAPTPLRALEPTADARVVAALQEALRRAESGELVSIGLVAQTQGRCEVTVYELGEGSIAYLVLACRRLERRLLDLGET